MGHYAKVENGIVTAVIVGEQYLIDSGIHGDPADWVQTSYNTRNGVHYGMDENGNYVPDGGLALRGNYAGIGHIYDKEHDVFYEPCQWPSWVINKTTWTWDPPIPYPADLGEKEYDWDEATVSFVERVTDTQNN
jgi:hypothetical protein